MRGGGVRGSVRGGAGRRGGEGEGIELRVAAKGARVRASS
jgi:hypothetical protein